MIDLFESVWREIQPVKDAVDRIETRLARQEAVLTRWSKRMEAK
jgi:hypothetical protein